MSWAGEPAPCRALDTLLVLSGMLLSIMCPCKSVSELKLIEGFVTNGKGVHCIVSPGLIRLLRYN